MRGFRRYRSAAQTNWFVHDAPADVSCGSGHRYRHAPTLSTPSDNARMAAMRAVLWDMDGTLVDSEKLWDIAMHALYARNGGVLTDEVRESTVGGSAETVMRIVYDDLGLDPDPAAMAESADWLHD